MGRCLAFGHPWKAVAHRRIAIDRLGMFYVRYRPLAADLFPRAQVRQIENPTATLAAHGKSARTSLQTCGSLAEIRGGEIDISPNGQFARGRDNANLRCRPSERVEAPASFRIDHEARDVKRPCANRDLLRRARLLAFHGQFPIVRGISPLQFRPAPRDSSASAGRDTVRTRGPSPYHRSVASQLRIA